ncbi:hypothetical protein [Ginsengibacter hankyongi]|uniref:hypothetical protein n=1 Tax=Ginsengibacter hankyongi TaxID=2607284 RepID=UPI0019279C05|nr:hypothetical protein [Ginsengibacter hankyongi]
MEKGGVYTKDGIHSLQSCSSLNLEPENTCEGKTTIPAILWLIYISVEYYKH